jgi:hypothetical protein
MRGGRKKSFTRLFLNQHYKQNPFMKHLLLFIFLLAACGNPYPYKHKAADTTRVDATIIYQKQYYSGPVLRIAKDTFTADTFTYETKWRRDTSYWLELYYRIPDSLRKSHNDSITKEVDRVQKLLIDYDKFNNK